MTVSTATEPATKSKWRVAIHWFQGLFVVLALGFAGRALSQQWGDMRNAASELHPQWLTLLGAGAIIMLNYAMLVQSWRTLVEGFGSKLRFPTAVRIYMASKLGGYIPGSFWSAAGMSIMAEQEGVQPSAAAGSAIIGTLLNIGAGFGVVALSGSRVLSAVTPSLRIGSWIGASLFLLFAIAAPWLLPIILDFIGKRFKRGVPDKRLPAKHLWIAVALNVVSWLGYGWALMVFSHAFYPAINGNVLQFVEVWTAAYIAGYVVFIVPAGLGVREFTLALLLFKLGLTGKAEATVLAFASRIWMTLLDVVPGLIGLALSPIAKTPKSKEVG